MVAILFFKQKTAYDRRISDCSSDACSSDLGEFSVAPLQHCFPVAGCVGYQGWYSEAAAHASAEQLASEGYDVYVGGVPAYSTLGWFDDPVLNTMLRWDDATLLPTLFHEQIGRRAWRERGCQYGGMWGVGGYLKTK